MFEKSPTIESKDLEAALETFNTQLSRWFEDHKRDFPWRKPETSPYAIWISEIMSQQTQIERVATFFWPRFMEKFPTLKSLAAVEWDEVFPIWNGLGYYSRGRNALECAKQILKNHEGKFPQNGEILETLPGIGKYTAAAILSFAYDKKVPAIDTNINKIISICFPGTDIIDTATRLVENSKSGCEWNSSMMDLASALRRGEPVTGDFGETFFPESVAKKFLPQKKSSLKRVGTAEKSDKKEGKIVKKDTRRLIEVGIACIWKDGKYLIQTRPKGKSFVGFWEFPGGKREKGENFRECVKREIQEEIGVEVSVRPHFYEETCHFKKARLHLRFHRAQIQRGVPQPLEGQELQWVKPDEFGNIKFLETNHKALKVLAKMRV